MKQTILLTTLIYSLTLLMTLAQAEVQWPTRSVVGLVGASYVTCSAPVNSPLKGVGYIGCSYEGLAVKMTKNHELDELNLTIQSAAEGGAKSYDIPDTGWLGYMSQFNLLKTRTFWLDGVPRLKYLVIEHANDCLHTIRCDEDYIRNVYTENIKQVANAATAQGIQVIILGYPNWEDINLPQLQQVFNLPYVADVNDYTQLKYLYEQELSQIPGVIFTNAWDNIETIDGWHPNDASSTKAADVVSRIIKKFEKGKI